MKRIVHTYCRFLRVLGGVFVPRRENEGVLSEAIQSFKEAMEIDNNQQTARDHLEKIQLQIKIKEQVHNSCLLTLLLQTYPCPHPLLVPASP